MFGKYQAVFRSRWRALLWAGGVCLTAYCTVPHADDASKSGSDTQDEDQAVAALVEAAGFQPQDKPKKHVNPWAKQPDSEQR